MVPDFCVINVWVSVRLDKYLTFMSLIALLHTHRYVGIYIDLYRKVSIYISHLTTTIHALSHPNRPRAKNLASNLLSLLNLLYPIQLIPVIHVPASTKPLQQSQSKNDREKEKSPQKGMKLKERVQVWV